MCVMFYCMFISGNVSQFWAKVSLSNRSRAVLQHWALQPHVWWDTTPSDPQQHNTITCQSSQLSCDSLLSVVLADVLEITPSHNNGTHGSLNHLLLSPPHTPRHPEEQSPPNRCPLISLEPTHTLGCTCPALVHNTHTHNTTQIHTHRATAVHWWYTTQSTHSVVCFRMKVIQTHSWISHMPKVKWHNSDLYSLTGKCDEATVMRVFVFV